MGKSHIPYRPSNEFHGASYFCLALLPISLSFWEVHGILHGIKTGSNPIVFVSPTWQARPWNLLGLNVRRSVGNSHIPHRRGNGFDRASYIPLWVFQLWGPKSKLKKRSKPKSSSNQELFGHGAGWSFTTFSSLFLRHDLLSLFYRNDISNESTFIWQNVGLNRFCFLFMNTYIFHVSYTSHFNTSVG